MISIYTSLLPKQLRHRIRITILLNQIALILNRKMGTMQEMSKLGLFLHTTLLEHQTPQNLSLPNLPIS